MTTLPTFRTLVSALAAAPAIAPVLAPRIAVCRRAQHAYHVATMAYFGADVASAA